MISTQEALNAIFARLKALPVETVSLRNAVGRVLAESVTALRDQPPFASSAMDGYAVAAAAPGASFTVIGEAQAGARFDGPVGPGEAVRIFTGAPVPEGATRIVIQEDVTRDGDTIILHENLDAGPYVRPAGGDFRVGTTLDAPTKLTPAHIALLASMNVPQISVHRRAKVALISTGDELVMPGETPSKDQILSSNAHGLEAMLGGQADVRLLPIARDTLESLHAVLDLIEDTDLVVTIGGASVGDHDLVAKVAQDAGLDRAFYKVAMRPGKPLMAGTLGKAVLVGLPGNPVSSMVCGRVFLRPALDVLHGLPARAARRRILPLAHDLAANGPREHYMRAKIIEIDGKDHISPFDRQDSSLQTVLASADALAIRPPRDPMRVQGEMIEWIDI